MASKPAMNSDIQLPQVMAISVWLNWTFLLTSLVYFYSCIQSGLPNCKLVGKGNPDGCKVAIIRSLE